MADLHWHCSPDIYDRYRTLLDRLRQCDSDWTEEAWVIKDELKLLPGFPHHMTEQDTVIPVLKSKPMSVILPASSVLR